MDFWLEFWVFLVEPIIGAVEVNEFDSIEVILVGIFSFFFK